MITVAALYVDELGPYPKMEGVDAWGIHRDARDYDGPYSIVAHPPCGPWSSLRHLYQGADHDCAIRAVVQVRRHGGVLEHPARSNLWRRCHLPFPGEMSDEFGGFTVEVDQCAWGHVARKKTWIYVIGVSRAYVASTTRTGGTPTHWASGGRNCKTGGSAPPGIKICSAQQRRRSPLEFAKWLVTLARNVDCAEVAAE